MDRSLGRKDSAARFPWEAMMLIDLKVLKDTHREKASG